MTLNSCMLKLDFFSYVPFETKVRLYFSDNLQIVLAVISCFSPSGLHFLKLYCPELIDIFSGFPKTAK